MTQIEVSTSVVKQWLPNYRKKTANVRLSQRVNTSSYWDGGSRSYYTLYVNGKATEIQSGEKPFTANNPHGSDHLLLPGHVLVETSVFCGKPGWATIHVCDPVEANAIAHCAAFAVPQMA